MTTFDDRENAFENKFAYDADMAFRIAARRNRIVAAWAAERMGLNADEAEAYAGALIEADFEEAGDEDVVRKLVRDLAAAAVDVSEADIRAALATAAADARRQLTE